MTGEEIGKQRMKEWERWADKMETKFPIMENVEPHVFFPPVFKLSPPAKKYNNSLARDKEGWNMSIEWHHEKGTVRTAFLKIVTEEAREGEAAESSGLISLKWEPQTATVAHSYPWYS